jgi:hypothetical protein
MNIITDRTYDAVYANLLSARELLVCVNTLERLLKILM